MKYSIKLMIQGRVVNHIATAFSYNDANNSSDVLSIYIYIYIYIHVE